MSVTAPQPSMPQPSAPQADSSVKLVPEVAAKEAEKKETPKPISFAAMFAPKTLDERITKMHEIGFFDRLIHKIFGFLFSKENETERNLKAENAFEKAKTSADNKIGRIREAIDFAAPNSKWKYKLEAANELLKQKDITNEDVSKAEEDLKGAFTASVATCSVEANLLLAKLSLAQGKHLEAYNHMNEAKKHISAEEKDKFNDQVACFQMQQLILQSLETKDVEKMSTEELKIMLRRFDNDTYAYVLATIHDYHPDKLDTMDVKQIFTPRKAPIDYSKYATVLMDKLYDERWAGKVTKSDVNFWYDLVHEKLPNRPIDSFFGAYNEYWKYLIIPKYWEARQLDLRWKLSTAAEGIEETYKEDKNSYDYEKEIKPLCEYLRLKAAMLGNEEACFLLSKQVEPFSVNSRSIDLNELKGKNDEMLEQFKKQDKTYFLRKAAELGHAQAKDKLQSMETEAKESGERFVKTIEGISKAASEGDADAKKLRKRLQDAIGKEEA